MSGAIHHTFPALVVSALLVVGILIGDALPSHGAVRGGILAVFVTLAAIVTLCLARQGRISGVTSVSVALLCILGGMLKIAVDRERTASPPGEVLGHEVVVLGRITDPPVEAGSLIRFPLEAAGTVDGTGARPLAGSILVTLRRARTDTTKPVLSYGMDIAVAGTLSVPTEERNPGEFSPKRYYEATGFSMLFSVRSYARLTVLDSAGGAWPVRAIVVPVRAWILDEIDRDIGGEEGEFLKGILVGIRSGMASSTRQSFMNAGVTHVLAVSGSNVAVVVAFFYFLFEFIRLPKWARLIVTAGALLLFMVLTGSQPPVVRATLMSLVFMAAGILQRRSNAFNTLGLSALIILAIDARQVFDVGFQLSFGAVLSILYLYPIANSWISGIDGKNRVWRVMRWVLRVCAVSLVATLGTLPLTAVYFGRVSVIGILVNIFVIPAVGVSVILGCVAAIAGAASQWIASVYASANWLVLHVTLAIVDYAGNSPFAYVDTLRFRFVDAIPYYAALALVFHFSRPAVVRTFIIILLLALHLALWVPPATLPAGQRGRLRVSFIDVGEGDAMLAEFPDGKTMLVDAGPRTPGFDAGERTVVPFLKRRGISTIDLCVVTHAHSDHCGGLPAVLRHINVRRIAGDSSLYAAAQAMLGGGVQEFDLRFSVVSAGTILPCAEGARVYVLSPDPRLQAGGAAATPRSNESVVVRLQYGATSFLLTGDAERGEEVSLMARYGSFLRSTLLKVGHHGSATSTSSGFLSAVQPDVAVISVGLMNRFNHPSPATVRRLEEAGIVVARTDADGAIMYESDGEILSRVDWR